MGINWKKVAADLAGESAREDDALTSWPSASELIAAEVRRTSATGSDTVLSPSCSLSAGLRFARGLLGLSPDVGFLAEQVHVYSPLRQDRREFWRGQGAMTEIFVSVERLVGPEVLLEAFLQHPVANRRNPVCLRPLSGDGSVIEQYLQFTALWAISYTGTVSGGSLTVAHRLEFAASDVQLYSGFASPAFELAK